jgi:arylsulfatase A-like enzyme
MRTSAQQQQRPTASAPLLLLIVLSGGSASATSSTVPAKLNVVHILMDDWGWGDAGVYGSPDGHQRRPVLTPSIDALAASGILFTDYHSASSVCSPSRAGWMTSRYPAELGIHTAFAASHASNVAQGMPDQLDPAVPNIARLLKEQLGYTTAHFGKWQ